MLIIYTSLQCARDDNLLHLCSDNTMLQVMPAAGHAKRMCQDARPVSVIGQCFTAGENPGADLSILAI